MIELMVAMAVLTIMMAFLIKAFTGAARLSRSGNKSMTVFERSTMALDFMANDLSQLSVNDLSRTKLSFTYSTTSCSFTCRLPFSDTPVDRKKINYEFASNALTRQVDTGTKEEILDGIESFTITFYDSSNTALPTEEPINSYPSYCEISLKLAETAKSENTQRTFTRRVYYE